MFFLFQCIQKCRTELDSYLLNDVFVCEPNKSTNESEKPDFCCWPNAMSTRRFQNAHRELVDFFSVHRCWPTFSFIWKIYCCIQIDSVFLLFRCFFPLSNFSSAHTKDISTENEILNTQKIHNQFAFTAKAIFARLLLFTLFSISVLFQDLKTQ